MNSKFGEELNSLNLDSAVFYIPNTLTYTHLLRSKMGMDLRILHIYI